jgi:hypothetical protein
VVLEDGFAKLAGWEKDNVGIFFIIVSYGLKIRENIPYHKLTVETPNKKND